MRTEFGSTPLSSDAKPIAPSRGTVAGQGLRSGMLQAGAGLSTLAATTADALGADGMAKGLYQTGAGLRARATEAAPEINSFSQVDDLNSALRYGVGTIAQGVPMIAAGLAGAAATRGRMPMMGATAAATPFAAGDLAVRQQEDPEIAKLSAGRRLGHAVGGGAATAALGMAVPTLMGGKLLGQGIGQAGMSMGRNVATNVGEAVLGNAAAGVAGEKVNQMSLGALNENRDTSMDRQALIDGAASGVVSGVPFAAMGIAGQAMHGKKPAPRTDGVPLDGAAPAAPAPSLKASLTTRLKGAFKKDDATIDSEAAKTISEDGDLVDVEALNSATPELQGQMLKDADESRVTKLTDWGKKLYEDADLAPESRAAIDDFMADPANRTKQAAVAGLKVAKDAGDAAVSMVKEFADFSSKKFDSAPKEGIKLSRTVSPELTAKMSEVIAPSLAEKFPTIVGNESHMKSVTRSITSLMDDMQARGKLDEDSVEQLHNWFGDDTPSVLAQLHDAVLGDNPAASEKYFAALNNMKDDMAGARSLEGQVKAAWPAGDAPTPSMIKQVMAGMREHMDGADMKGKSKDEIAFRTKDIEDTLRAQFGDKAPGLLKAFEKDTERRHAKLNKEQAELAKQVDQDDLDAGGFADTVESGVTDPAERVYFGGGKDKRKPTFVPSEAAHRAKFGNDNGQASKLLREARAANPDMVVKTVSAEVYAREHDIGRAQLMDMTDGNPQDYVMVMAEGAKRDGLTWKDTERLKHNTHDYPDSPSRIRTDSDMSFDAIKVLNEYASADKMAFNDIDEISPSHRMARQFKQAIGELSDLLGEAIDVPKETVVARRNGKGITWGELQKASRVKPNEKDAAGDNIFKAREDAVKRGDADETASIDDDLSQRAMEANDPDDALVDGQKKVSAVNNDRADRVARDRVAGAAKALGAARKAVEVEIEKNGPLRDGNDKIIRPLTTKERALIKAHDKIVGEYERREGRVGRDRPTEFDAAKEQLMMGEAPLDRNIHWGEKEYGDALGARFKASEQMEAGKEGNLLHADNFRNNGIHGGNVKAVIRGGIESRLSKLENLRSDDGKVKNMIAAKVAEKGRALLGIMDKMSNVDQAMMATLVKDKKVASIAEVVNDLTRKYAAMLNPPEPPTTPPTTPPTKPPRKPAPWEIKRDAMAAKLKGQLDTANANAAKKPSAFTERVLGEGDLAPVIKAIKTSDDVRAVQRAVDALQDHLDNPRARQVLDAANERIMSMIEADPDVAYSMQKTNPGTKQTSKVRADVEAHIKKVFAGSVDVEFKKMLNAGSFSTIKGRAAQGMSADVIRVSVYALDPMGTGMHESMHALFKKMRTAGLMDAASPLLKAADSFAVKAQLAKLLDGEPDALKQLHDIEERAAYMYQFWAAGKLQLAEKPTTVLGHIKAMLHKVMGMWTNDERAVHIMEYFQSGEYGKNMGQPSAVRAALMKGTNAHVESFKKLAAPLSRLADATFATGNGRVRDTMIPALMELADKVYAPLQGASDDPGYVPAARVKQDQVMNKLADGLGRFDEAVVADALKSLQQGLKKGATGKESSAMLEIRKTLDSMYEYMTEAGVDLNDLGYGKDYFPRVWDADTIINNDAGFRAMLEQYRVKGDWSGNTDQLIAALTRNDGSELQIETVKPGMTHTKQRKLAFISALDAEPFLQKNLFKTMNSYVTQATRRAEWSRRFKDDGSGLHDLFDRARKEGATDGDIQLASDYLQGVDGTLGDTINPTLRRAFGSMIVYQNLRVLPLMIFSSLIDPGGIMVRGGTASEAFGALKRGLKEIPKGFKKDAVHDSWTDLAATMGVIENSVLMRTVGSSFAQGMSGGTGRAINDAFFKYNLMAQYNTSMRVGATEAAVSFLGRHADGTESPHSKRWLAELGFAPGDIKVKNGRPLLTEGDFRASGMKPDAAQAAADRMALAVNKWVDGAVLRPNAAHKPIWMNDPRFILLSHLKQFVYSFQETILKRAVNEARHGNVGPAYALAAYVPFMIAADLMKGMVVGGGEQPDYKENWDLGDYIASGVQRSGLTGVGQIGIDVKTNLDRGGWGVGAVVGPTIEQMGDVVQTVGGSRQFKTTVMDALPANQLFDAAGEALSPDPAL